MSAKIGIIYASIDGQTKKICEYIKSKLDTQNNIVEIISIDNFEKTISEYKILIIGSSIRYGKHHKSIYQFINSHNTELSHIKTSFFSVNLIARNKNKNTPSTNPYLIKFLKGISWEPTLVDVFGGKLDYSLYPFFNRIMIKIIMKMTDGPTKTKTAIEYTDWKKVDAFCLKVSKL